MVKKCKDKKYLFYTPMNLADFLIKRIEQSDCKHVIDICCGSWNLLRAAKHKYPLADVVGVDVDEEAQKHQLTNSQFYHMDGRAYALKCLEDNIKYDLVLSNPPFGHINENERILYNLNNENIMLELLNKRYETEMILANLLLVRPGGSILFILPSSFIEGVRCNKIRKYIGETYKVRALFSLPNETFGKREIRTWAIWLDAVAPDNSDVDIYYIKTVDQADAISASRKVGRQNIRTGNWLGREMLKEGEALNIYRGNLHSKEFTNTGNLVLHCAAVGKDGIWKPSIRHTNQVDKRRAQVGDIIINRVGRSAGYWCINDEPNIMVSDCIIVIHNCEEQVIKMLEQKSINNRLHIPIYGTTTQYITVRDIRMEIQ